LAQNNLQLQLTCLLPLARSMRLGCIFNRSGRFTPGYLVSIEQSTTFDIDPLRTRSFATISINWMKRFSKPSNDSLSMNAN